MSATSVSESHPVYHSNSSFGRLGMGLVILLLLGGAVYVVSSLINAVQATDAGIAEAVPWLLLVTALFIALAFEFVNGFHDAANAVATVIYTRSMPPHFAVVWSGVFNFLGVNMANGAVAWGIVSLLPVELILQVNSGAGMSMVFALLFAAILWNFGTWWLGLPASSSHTLIGSIIGVGIANQLLAPEGTLTSGVNWSKATEVGLSLLFSPIIGFIAGALLLLAIKVVVKNRELFEEPDRHKGPPLWIRSVLIGTCTLVSFAHGSNDGQKGMGLIMLILVGVVPTAFALNRTPDATVLDEFRKTSQAAIQVLDKYIKPDTAALTDENARKVLEVAVRDKKWQEGATTLALQIGMRDLVGRVNEYKTLANVPTGLVSNLRNDLYIISETLKLLEKKHPLDLSAADKKQLTDYGSSIGKAVRFIPVWVKVGVALALGLGTMIGWKRIVVTVGEKIGKSHMTYGQGAAAQTVAAVTIGMADVLGLPVSTTHVLSSGVAGTMASNGSGLQWSTIRGILTAWVLTLPASMALSGGLFALFRHFST
jgi:PiT family inorganic phosphate transporter